ncbi:hypothetical protein [Rhodopila globiformis]|uniref:Uncharacterized protein n=1 Tax=Rhodopila globiformis TaxID=1071 RepID=A0A2S6NJZ9_RHOGL|nr:hypothetical protein [Rhodopila globiformis]PPQ35287.1 hypothetical protein CCS01_08025 [Rhodopila globiformis]
MVVAIVPRLACGAEGLDMTLPPTSMPVQSAATAPTDPPADPGGFSDFLATWKARAAQARATQPAWSSPLVTTSGMLEQRIRFDMAAQHSGNGTNTTVLDGGKGIDLIVGPTTEIQFAVAPYDFRTGVPGTGPKNKGAIASLNGFGDWPFVRIKQRLASGSANEGNYFVSALFQIQAPTGIARLTSDAWTLLPTLAFGKGWGAFDIQGTVGGILPLSSADRIGYQVATNVAFQYHVLRVLWPELEVNWIYYANGQRGGLNQVYLTPGLVAGRLPLSDNLKFTLGVGYQVAVSPAYVARPLTPAYNHAWLLTTRMNF